MNSIVRELQELVGPTEAKMINDSLAKGVSSALLTCGNHCNDNSFISNDLNDFISDFSRKGYMPYGVCKNPPYNGYDRPMIAYVFYDELNEVRWVHMPTKTLLNLLAEMYGKETAKIFANM